MRNNTPDDTLGNTFTHIPYCDDTITAESIKVMSVEDFRKNYGNPSQLSFISNDKLDARISRALISKVLGNIDTFIHVAQTLEGTGRKPEGNYKKLQRDFDKWVPANSEYKSVFAKTTYQEALTELQNIHHLTIAPTSLISQSLSAGASIQNINAHLTAPLEDVLTHMPVKTT
jgi:hypothetical protein